VSAPSQPCPVLAKAKQALASGQEFLRALRGFRSSLQRCEACPVLEDCPMQTDLQSQINQAIAEITEEWGLS
jgi:hypothetical protein